MQHIFYTYVNTKYSNFIVWYKIHDNERSSDLRVYYIFNRASRNTKRIIFCIYTGANIICIIYQTCKWIEVDKMLLAPLLITPPHFCMVLLLSSAHHINISDLRELYDWVDLICCSKLYFLHFVKYVILFDNVASPIQQCTPKAFCRQWSKGEKIQIRVQ